MSRNVFMDFTETKSITFRVGDQEFHAYPDVPMLSLVHVDRLRTRSDDETQQEFMDKIVAVILALLYPESAERFRAALEAEGSFFMGINGLMNLQMWLSEQVTGRPTQESSDSLPTSDETGESLTDGLSVPE